jgi:N-acetylglucosamine kinase-like BadF-type ATPase
MMATRDATPDPAHGKTARREPAGDQTADALVLAVDAGGTKTSAWLAEAQRAEPSGVLGRGRSTSANPLCVGFAEAARAIAEAVDQARREARHPATRIRRAVLAVAGAADPAIRDQFLRWARASGLAEQVAVVPDVLPVLAAGTPDCYGVALVAGTGSVAFARAPDGRTIRCGGWGYLVGDDGSGYAIGRAAVRHTLDHIEANIGPSRLAPRVLESLDAQSVAALTTAIYRSPNPRAMMASLAPAVIQLAEEGDASALAIVESAGRDLADLAARAARSVALADQSFVVAAGGGILVGSMQIQDQVRSELNNLGLQCELEIVQEPLVGCLRLAAHEFAGLDIDWR